MFSFHLALNEVQRCCHFLLATEHLLDFDLLLRNGFFSSRKRLVGDWKELRQDSALAQPQLRVLKMRFDLDMSGLALESAKCCRCIDLLLGMALL
jgi:hypothetical protein